MFFGTPNGDGEYTVTGWKMLIPISFWFIMTVALEQIAGATLGNGIVGLKPIHEDGSTQKISIIQSFKRHVLDFIDMFFFGLIAYITITNTSKRQRLGDLWAKTMVVKYRRK